MGEPETNAPGRLIRLFALSLEFAPPVFCMDTIKPQVAVKNYRVVLVEPYGNYFFLGAPVPLNLKAMLSHTSSN